MEFGKYGIWTTYFQIGEGRAHEAASLLEELGFGTIWVGMSPRIRDLRPLLEGSEKIVVASSIANIWVYESEPGALAAEYEELERDFPGRVLAGIGVGHPEATTDYSKPLSSMRRFLDGIDAAPEDVPVERRALAALGPKMVDLSAERSLGALPYFSPVAHTKFARERLGPGPFLAPEVACVVDPDPDSGRAKARDYAQLYLRLSNYTNNLRRLGYGDEDLGDGGSDALIDAVIPHGTAEDIARAGQEHMDAGADHIAFQTVGVDGMPEEAWRALAEVLFQQGG